jgi:hypothetical protein
MKSGYVKSYPEFFRLISRSIYALIALLLVLAAFIPAPLQEQANPAVTPNPAKSAWFLLWIQELVSWSSVMIYPVILSGCIFIAVPWLPVGSSRHSAKWFPPEQSIFSAIIVFLTLIIISLTIVAYFFRGTNWSFTY